MTHSAAPVPSPLREAVARDLVPVRPLASPRRRAILLGALGAASLVFAAFRIQVVGAPSALGLLIAAAEWTAALGMVWVAMREAVPGEGVSRSAALAALGAGLAVQLGAAGLLSTSVGARWLGDGGLSAGVQCAAGEGAFGLPVFVAAFWLLLRAFPFRARLTSALASAAAGLFADAGWHLVCTRTDFMHLVVWHFGSTLALAAIGYVVGIGVERRTSSGREAIPI